jgi:hypothetical protein
MPYIDQESRHQIDEHGRKPTSAGELNYCITKLCTEYCEIWGLTYSHINNVLGALEGAKQEFYRRVAIPYEDKKRGIHGDVYPKKLITV